MDNGGNALNSHLYQKKRKKREGGDWDNHPEKHSIIKTGIGQIEQSDEMKLHMVWQHLMR